MEYATVRLIPHLHRACVDLCRATYRLRRAYAMPTLVYAGLRIYTCICRGMPRDAKGTQAGRK